MNTTMEHEIFALADEQHYQAGRTHAVDTVVVHATAGTNSVRWLSRTSNPPVSCHVLVTKSGQRVRIVRDSDTAWHAGYGMRSLTTGPSVNLNARSLGIELENLNDGKDPYPFAQVDAAGYQIAEWLIAFPGLRIYRHLDVDSRKWDPAGLDMETLYGRVYEHLCRMHSN